MTPTKIDPGAGYWELADRYDVLWVFETARFTVALFAELEDCDPADAFERDDGIACASDGEPAHWFRAVVAVYDSEGNRIGLEVLGGCSYTSFAEFYTSHRDPNPASRNTLAMKAQNRGFCHYFPEMVRAAVAAARKEG